MDDLQRIEVVFDDVLAGLASTVERVPGGVALRTRELPLVWTLNQVRVHESLELDALLEVAERAQGDLPYRHLVVRPGAYDPHLDARFAELGWRVEHDLIMGLHDREPGPVDDRIAELPEAAMLGLLREWLLEEWAGSSEGLDQVLEYNRREGRLLAERVLGVVHDGIPSALTKVRRAGGVGWVEDVYTRPAARGNGYATALVGRAVDLALADGAQLVTIVADADDWPQHLYAKVGFSPIARAAIYHRG